MRVILATVALAALVVCAGVLVGCEDRGYYQDPEAQRLNAQAGLERAKAEADAERTRANTEAEAERASVRQMERDAAHQRALDLLPYVLTIAGGLVLTGFALVLFWDLRTMRQAQPAASDRALLAPPTIHVWVLPPAGGHRRADLWREVEGAARGEVVLYNERRS